MPFRNESKFVKWLVSQASKVGKGLVAGIGDDAAIVKASPHRHWVLTSDLSIEGVHFASDLQTPGSVGHRAFARSLSDIAAMGGTPRFALISLALSRKLPPAWLKGFYAGVFRLARLYKTALIGGDTAVVDNQTTIDAMLLGEVPTGRAVLRSGASPGDQVYVSGVLGASALGLGLLKSRSRVRSPWAKAALRQFLRPEPRVALGRFLAQRRLASSMIDISDGLSSDLGRLCAASKVGAAIWEKLLPQPASVRRGPTGSELLRMALHGGEDYELLFTVAPRNISKLPSEFGGVPVHRIGEIQKSSRVVLIRSHGEQERLMPAGFDHFRGLGRRR